MHFGKDLLQILYKQDEQECSLSQDMLWDISQRYQKLGHYFDEILEVKMR